MSNELRDRALARGERPTSRWFYRAVRAALRLVLCRWLRVRVVDAEVLDRPGPLILAPVHRSHLDSALLGAVSRRRIRALGKESLFTTPVVGWVCAALGAIPVRRGAADREALAAARTLLERGEPMIVFPEGGRGRGPEPGTLLDGAAWLSAKTGTPVVPIGIAGTEAALGQGGRLIRRSTVTIVVGKPIPPPDVVGTRTVPRSVVRAATDLLDRRLVEVQRAAVLDRQARMSHQ